MKKRNTALIVMGLILFSSFSVINTVSNATTLPPYDQAIPLLNGHSFYIRYSNFTVSELALAKNYLTLYAPLICNMFWQPEYDIHLLVYTNSDANAGGCYPVYDSNGNILYYYGNIELYAAGTDLVSLQDPGALHTLLHEFTHVLQFTLVQNYFNSTKDDYMNKMASYLESIANAVPSIVMYEQTHSLMPQCGYSTNQRVASHQQEVGEAGYLQDTIYHGSNSASAWMELYTIDSNIFQDFNYIYLSNRSLGVRDIIRTVMLNYSYYSYNGQSIDDYLDGFGFYNSIDDITENTNMISWYALNSFQYIPNAALNESLFLFQGLTFANRAGYGSFVPVSTYTITVSDAQSRKSLYNATGSGPTIYAFLVNIIPSRELMRVDLTASYNTSIVNLTAYLARQRFCEYILTGPPSQGEKVIFFLDSDGFVSGNGTSNVGPISNGVLKWNSPDFDILANVTHNSHAYSYNIQNIVAHPAVGITQIGVNLQNASVILSPIPQRINDKNAVTLQAHISPLVSAGSVTFYSSQDNTHWTQITKTTPIDGAANATVTNLLAGYYYFKAVWSGDGYLNESCSSPVETSIVSSEVSEYSPNPTRTPAPTPVPTATPSPSPSPTPSPTTTPHPTVTPSPVPTPTSTPTPTETPNPTVTPSPLPSPTATPSGSPKPIETPLPTDSPHPTTNPTINPATTPSGTPQQTLPSPTSNPTTLPSPTPTAPEITVTVAIVALTLSSSLAVFFKRNRNRN